MTVNNKLTLQNGTLLTSIISLRECSSACMQPSDIHFIHKSNSLHWIVLKTSALQLQTKSRTTLNWNCKFLLWEVHASSLQRTAPGDHLPLYARHKTFRLLRKHFQESSFKALLCYPPSSPSSANFEGFFKTCLFRGGRSSLPLLYKEETILIFKGYLKLNLTFSQKTYTHTF